LQEQSIARIIQRSLAYEGKALAWRTAEYDVDLSFFQTSPRPNFGARNLGRIRANRSATGEIEFMDGAMHRIYFDRGDDIETGLFESEGQPASSRKQIDSDRPP
jgi:hypothetical protein